MLKKGIPTKAEELKGINAKINNKNFTSPVPKLKPEQCIALWRYTKNRYSKTKIVKYK